MSIFANANKPGFSLSNNFLAAAALIAFSVVANKVVADAPYPAPSKDTQQSNITVCVVFGALLVISVCCLMRGYCINRQAENAARGNLRLTGNENGEADSHYGTDAYAIAVPPGAPTHTM